MPAPRRPPKLGRAVVGSSLRRARRDDARTRSRSEVSPPRGRCAYASPPRSAAHATPAPRRPPKLGRAVVGSSLSVAPRPYGAFAIGSVPFRRPLRRAFASPPRSAARAMPAPRRSTSQVGSRGRWGGRSARRAATVRRDIRRRKCAVRAVVCAMAHTPRLQVVRLAPGVGAEGQPKLGRDRTERHSPSDVCLSGGRCAAHTPRLHGAPLRPRRRRGVRHPKLGRARRRVALPRSRRRCQDAFAARSEPSSRRCATALSSSKECGSRRASAEAVAPRRIRLASQERRSRHASAEAFDIQVGSRRRWGARSARCAATVRRDIRRRKCAVRAVVCAMAHTPRVQGVRLVPAPAPRDIPSWVALAS
jgi:hypothetical protein